MKHSIKLLSIRFNIKIMTTIFLLDDGRFHFFRFDIYKEKDSPFTIEDFNTIIDERLEYLRNITQEELLFTNIDTIFVNGEEKKIFLLESKVRFFFVSILYISIEIPF